MKINQKVMVLISMFKPTKFKIGYFFNVTIILYCLLIDSLCASGQRIDSLKDLLASEFGPGRIKILYELADHYVDIDNKVGLQFIDEAVKISNKNGDSLMLVRSGRLKALLYRRLSEIDSSMVLSQAILLIAERNHFTNELKRILNGLAIGYTFQGHYDKALTCYMRVLELLEQNGNNSEKSVILNNMGLVYFKLNDYDKALFYYNKSLELKKHLKNPVDYDFLLLNISVCHAYKSNYVLAKEFVDLAFSLCQANCSDRFLMTANFNLGLISYGLKNWPEAETQFYNSLVQARKVKNERLQFDNLAYLLEIHNTTNRVFDKKEFIQSAERLLETSTFYKLGKVQLYRQLFITHKKLGNLQKVTFYQSKYIEFRDSLYNEDLTTNLMRVEASFLEKENKSKIDSQAKILALNNEVILRQRILNVVIGIVSVLLVVLTFFLIHNIRRKKIVNDLLEQGVRQRTLELEINHNMLLKSLEERNIQFHRISLEVKSSLATINGLCRLGLHDGDLANTYEYIEKIRETSDSLLVGLHRTLVYE